MGCRPQLAGPKGSVNCRSVVVRAWVLCENVNHSVIHRFRCWCSSGLSKLSSTRSVENERSVVMVQLSLLHVSIPSCTRGHNVGSLCLSAPYSYQFQDPPLIPSSLLGRPCYSLSPRSHLAPATALVNILTLIFRTSELDIIVSEARS